MIYGRIGPLQFQEATVNDLYREFAERMIDYFEYRRNWSTCPYCLWVFRAQTSPEHTDCILKDIDEELRAEGR